MKKLVYLLSNERRVQILRFHCVLCWMFVRCIVVGLQAQSFPDSAPHNLIEVLSVRTPNFLLVVMTSSILVTEIAVNIHEASLTKIYKKKESESYPSSSGPEFNTYACFNVGTALIVGLSQHAQDREEDLFHTLDRTPALRAGLVHVGIISWCVQDRNTDRSILVDYFQLEQEERSEL